MTTELIAAQWLCNLEANQERYEALVRRNAVLRRAYEAVLDLPEHSNIHRVILANELLKDLPAVSEATRRELAQLAARADNGEL